MLDIVRTTMMAQLTGPTVMLSWLVLNDIPVLWRGEWARRRSSSGQRLSHLWRFTTTIIWCQHGQLPVLVCICL